MVRYSVDEAIPHRPATEAAVMLTRRRFVTIAASAGALPFLPAARMLAAAEAPVAWHGVAMGAMASIILDHPDRRAGQRLLDRCVAEIERLETILSLYRSDSALRRLNQYGELEDPPPELVEVLSAAVSLAAESNGAFDPTVQPLYELYARHFSGPRADSGGPPPDHIANVLERIGYRFVEITSDRISLRHEGMSITLNGIAQGYITDRVADLIAAEGLENMLIDLGELRAAGMHPDGRPWRTGIADPQGGLENVLFTLEVPDRPSGLPALATSGGYGTRFDTEGKHHHLLDPVTGRSASHYVSVSVVAPTALLADGLSTALYVAPVEQGAGLIERYNPARAYMVDSEGTIAQLG